MTISWRRSSHSGHSGDNCVELAVVVHGGMESRAGK
ncbi:DUF397 domain-containing protein [Actinoallomurus acanthiterrae]